MNREVRNSLTAWLSEASRWPFGSLTYLSYLGWAFPVHTDIVLYPYKAAAGVCHWDIFRTWRREENGKHLRKSFWNVRRQQSPEAEVNLMDWSKHNGRTEREDRDDVRKVMTSPSDRDIRASRRPKPSKWRGEKGGEAGFWSKAL